jgi:hypothetical protein
VVVRGARRVQLPEVVQEGVYVSFNPNLGVPAGRTPPAKILDAAEPEKSKWYPQVIGLDPSNRETDKLAGKTARPTAGYVDLMW